MILYKYSKKIAFSLVFISFVQLNIYSFEGEKVPAITTRIVRTFSNKNSDEVTLEIESSKNTIHIGDDFILTYRIVNNSNSDIVVLPNILWRDHAFRFFSQNIDGISYGSKTHIEWAIRPMKNNFIQINQGEAFEAFVSVKTQKNYVDLQIYDGYQTLYFGSYFYFRTTDFYVLLKNIDKLNIKGVYYLLEEEESTMLQFGFQGSIKRLTSETITLKIIEDFGK